MKYSIRSRRRLRFPAPVKASWMILVLFIAAAQIVITPPLSAASELSLVKDINPGEASSNINSPTNVNGTFYFTTENA